MVKMKDTYSFELKEVLTYIEDILIFEYPTYLVTPEYLLVSIMDSRTCHASILLDNCMMSSNFEKLKKIYVDLLAEHTNSNAKVTKETIRYNDDFKNILKWAEEEHKKTNSGSVGTEHIILALLCPDNENMFSEVFEQLGLKYDFVKSRCIYPKDVGPKKEKPKKKTGNVILNIPNDIIATASAFVEKFTQNINDDVLDGIIDSTFGRDNEIDEIISTLSRRKKNNVVLVGPSGCGLTQIVYGLAERIVNGTVPDQLIGKKIVKLNATALFSDTSLRGSLEARVDNLFKEFTRDGNYILFLDDMHVFISGRERDKDCDISGPLASILSSGRVKIIGTTSFKQYRNTIEHHPQIKRLMRKMVIEPMSKEDTFMIIRSNKEKYETHYNVKYTDDAIMSAIELAGKYMQDSTLPDSAIDVIDMCGSKVGINGSLSKKDLSNKKEIKKIHDEEVMLIKNKDYTKLDKLEEKRRKLEMELDVTNRKHTRTKKTITITPKDITETVELVTGIPASELTTTDKEKLKDMSSVLKQHIIGQDEAVDSVCRVIRRNRVGLGDKTKTMANILMVGPSGCGKTLIAKKLAEHIFGSENNLIRIDMSEYSEKSSVSKLTGAAPGYVGYDNGGQLTEAVKNKQHCVLLFDEIEKANEEVYNVFLQLMDDARLTDSSGQIVSFKNVIVLMTSNIGARQVEELGDGVGFVHDGEANKKSIINKQLKRRFTPEFLNRIDKVVFFNQLTNDNLRDIVKLELEKLRKRIVGIGFDVDYDDNAISFIYEKALSDRKFGARPIIRLIQDNVEDLITDELISSDYNSGYVFKITSDGNFIKLKK